MGGRCSGPPPEFRRKMAEGWDRKTEALNHVLLEEMRVEDAKNGVLLTQESVCLRREDMILLLPLFWWNFLEANSLPLTRRHGGATRRCGTVRAGRSVYV